MQTKLDAQFWQSRYQNEATGWDIGYPAPPLCREFDNIQNKNAAMLIPGCGNGYEAEYLIKNGFTNITVLDIAASPLADLKLRLGQAEGISFVHQDFFKHQGHYDYIVEQTFFCALEPQMRPLYVTKMESLLTNRGLLFGLLFNVKFEKEGPPFGGKVEEYQALFARSLKFEYKHESQSILPRQGKEIFFTAQKLR